MADENQELSRKMAVVETKLDLLTAQITSLFTAEKDNRKAFERGYEDWKRDNSQRLNNHSARMDGIDKKLDNNHKALDDKLEAEVKRIETIIILQDKQLDRLKTIGAVITFLLPIAMFIIDKYFK